MKFMMKKRVEGHLLLMKPLKCLKNNCIDMCLMIDKLSQNCSKGQGLLFMQALDYWKLHLLDAKILTDDHKKN